MSVFIVSKGIGGLNAYTKPPVVAAFVAIITGIFVGCEQPYNLIPEEAVEVSAPTSAEIAVISEDVKQLVKGLEHSDKVAQDFVSMVNGWKDAKRRPILIVCKKKLTKAKEDYKQGRISKAELAKVEQSIAKELSQKIKKEISYDDEIIDLAGAIKHKSSQCHGYSEIFYVLGSSVELSVVTVDVMEVVNPGQMSVEKGHVCSLVSIANDKTVMLDVTGKPTPMVSEPFDFEKVFLEVGECWELKAESNPLGIHRRIRKLDKNGLIAGTYLKRGIFYCESGQTTQAISSYKKAVELDPRNASIYSNRAIVYTKLGQYDLAVSDCSRAIELDPRHPAAYYNRGNAFSMLDPRKAISDYNETIRLVKNYRDSQSKLAEAFDKRGLVYQELAQYPQAISDFTKAIQLNPRNSKTYNHRGVTYLKLREYLKSISDLTNAIQFNPNYAEAYGARGTAYAILGKFEEAKKDLLKAIELNPALEAAVKKLSDHFKLNLELD